MSNDLINGFRLGETEVYPARGLIKGPAGDVHVEPKFMDVLLCLADRAGEVVDRDTLIHTVWGHAAVTDDSVNQSISQLRAYLDDDRHSPIYVETVPKRGYRLIAAVAPLTAVRDDDAKLDSELAEPTSSPGERRSLAPQLLVGIVAGVVAALIVVAVLQPFGSNDESLDPFQPPENSVAVMPFTDLSETGEHIYFGEGLAEDLQIALSRVEGMLVVARSSSFAYRDRGDDIRSIGRQLNVRAILEGSVRLEDNRIRVTTRLVDTRNGYQIWTNSYDQEFSGVFDVQQDIAQSVVQALEQELLSTPASSIVAAPTRSFNAYNLYLLGRFYWHQRTPESLALAAEYFEQATSLDPEYALAYSGLVDSYVFMTLYGGMPVDEARIVSEPVILNALKYGDDLAEVHASHGLYQSYLRGDFAAAGAAHERSRQINPNYIASLRWRAVGYSTGGNFASAMEVLEQAYRIDPLNQSIRSRYFTTLMQMGRYEDAMTTFRIWPWLEEPDATMLRAVGTWAGAYGQLVEGHEFAREALRKDPNGPITLVGLVQLYLQIGELEQASISLREASSVAPDNLAVFVWQSKVLAARGEFDELLDFTSEHLEAVDTDPPGFAVAWGLYYLGVAALLNGDSELAIASLERLVVREEQLFRELEALISIEIHSYLALAYDRAGDAENAASARATARALIEKAIADGWGTPQLDHIVAGLTALEGRREEATNMLATILNDGLTTGRRGSWKGFWSIEFDPALDGLRETPGFLQLVERVNAEQNGLRSELADSSASVGDSSE